MRYALRLALGVGLAVPAHAQPTTSPLILDQNRADRVSPAPTPPAVVPKQAAVAVAADDTRAKVVIRGIAFVPHQVPARVAAAARGFVGRKASRKTLEALAGAMSKAYAKANVALYTVAVPQQDFANGIVRIVAFEGRLQAVTITDGKGKPRRLVHALADPLTHHAPLTRVELERAMSLIRDIPGLVVDAQIVQGDAPDAVKLAITTKQKRPTVEFGFDNRTAEGLGPAEVSATAHAYGSLREGDETVLGLAAATDLKRYRYASLTHSTPLGGSGLRLSVNGAYLRTRPKNIPITGDAKAAGISLSYPIIRGYQRNLSASLSLDGLNSDNAAFGLLIARERTRAGRFALGYSDATPKRSYGISATVSQGIDFAGAKVTAPLSQLGFLKANARANYDQAIGKRLVAHLRVAGQYSRDRLPAAERFAVGGAEFGRAFDAAVLTADRGAAASAELAVRPLAKGPLAGTELYTFVDGAKVKILDRGPYPGGTYDLASTGVGARLAYTTKAALSLEGAKAIDRPYAGNRDDWRVSVGWRLSL